MAGERGEDGFRPGRRNRIIDERRRTVVMLESADLPPDAPKRVRRAVRNANRHRIVPVILWLGIVVGLWLLFVAAIYTRPRASSFSASTIMPSAIQIVLGPVLGIFLGAKQVGHNARIAHDSCLAHRICPSCGYDLRGTAADPVDGCTICPECGAAWRLGRTGP
jgi:hypothetical protein